VKQISFPGSSNHEYGLTIDQNSGTLYVAEGGTNTVEKITSSGTASTFVTGVTPRGLATDSSGDVWVGNNNEIEEFDSTGTAINSTFASTGSGNNITGLVVDSGGDVYAAANSKIYEYNSAGGLINTISDTSVEGVSLDPSGDLWATGGSSTKAYSPSGTLLNTFSTPEAFSNAYVVAVPEPSASILVLFGLAFGGGIFGQSLRRKMRSIKGN
jgi:streptogramin lyase